MKKYIYLAALVIPALAYLGCDSTTYQEIADDTANPVYNIHIKPIIENNCASCHNPENGQQPYYQTYEEVKTVTLAGPLICRIDETCGSVMPPTGRMPQTTIDIIKRWRDQGCPEN